MSQHGPDPDPDLPMQREVARIALAGVDGFALAGSGAIREHGIIDRPTEDVDLFTASQDEAEFSTAVDVMTRAAARKRLQRRAAAPGADVRAVARGHR